MSEFDTSRTQSTSRQNPGSEASLLSLAGRFLPLRRELVRRPATGKIVVRTSSARRTSIGGHSRRRCRDRARPRRTGIRLDEVPGSHSRFEPPPRPVPPEQKPATEGLSRYVSGRSYLHRPIESMITSTTRVGASAPLRFARGRSSASPSPSRRRRASFVLRCSAEFSFARIAGVRSASMDEVGAAHPFRACGSDHQARIKVARVRLPLWSLRSYSLVTVKRSSGQGSSISLFRHWYCVSQVEGLVPFGGRHNIAALRAGHYGSPDRAGLKAADVRLFREKHSMPKPGASIRGLQAHQGRRSVQLRVHVKYRGSWLGVSAGSSTVSRSRRVQKSSSESLMSRGDAGEALSRFLVLVKEDHAVVGDSFDGLPDRHGVDEPLDPGDGFVPRYTVDFARRVDHRQYRRLSIKKTSLSLRYLISTKLAADRIAAPHGSSNSTAPQAGSRPGSRASRGRSWPWRAPAAAERQGKARGSAPRVPCPSSSPDRPVRITGVDNSVSEQGLAQGGGAGLVRARIDDADGQTLAGSGSRSRFSRRSWAPSAWSDGPIQEGAALLVHADGAS